MVTLETEIIIFSLCVGDSVAARCMARLWSRQTCRQVVEEGLPSQRRLKSERLFLAKTSSGEPGDDSKSDADDPIYSRMFCEVHARLGLGPCWERGEPGRDAWLSLADRGGVRDQAAAHQNRRVDEYADVAGKDEAQEIRQGAGCDQAQKDPGGCPLRQGVWAERR